MGLATLESLSFSLGKNVMFSHYLVSMRFARWCAGRDRCLSSRYIVCFSPPGQGGRMIVVFYRNDGRGFAVWGRTRETAFPDVHKLWLYFSPRVAGWMGSFCRNVCGGLERQSGTRFALPARHHRCRALPWLTQSWCMFVLYRCYSRRGVWA